MQKILMIITIAVLLGGCVHKMDIEQGNIITQNMVNNLHTGMTEAEVRDIMGSPMLENTFDDNRLDYVYTYKPAYGSKIQKSLTLSFRNHRLQSIGGNMYSQYLQH